VKGIAGVMELSDLEIHTERLTLRPLTIDDIGIIHQIWTDAGVRKFMWDDEIISLEEASAVVEKSVKYFRCKGYGLWAVLPRGEEQIIGFSGYWFFHEPPQLELLYGIITDQWGKGLAPEAAKAMLRYGFEELGFDEVKASADAANVASERVMEKLGMKFTTRREAEGLDTIFYTIKRAEFQGESSNGEFHLQADDRQLAIQHT
jgi:ribosomal-protein-alanine N-acetyltransferase